MTINHQNQDNHGTTHLGTSTLKKYQAVIPIKNVLYEFWRNWRTYRGTCTQVHFWINKKILI